MANLRQPPLTADLNDFVWKQWFNSVYRYVAELALSAGSVASVTASSPLASSGGANPNISLTGTVGVANGGTGIASYTVGDIIYASGATTLSKLADVATGNALISGGVGVAPSWGKVGLTTHVSGTLPVANGGTGGTDAATARSNLSAAGISGTPSTDQVAVWASSSLVKGSADMSIDSSGNISYDATTIPASLSYIHHMFPANAVLAWTAAGGSMWLVNNAYYASSAWKYNATDEASAYKQFNGTHAFYAAASGTGGTGLTWGLKWLIDNNGNLIGGQSAASWGWESLIEGRVIQLGNIANIFERYTGGGTTFITSNAYFTTAPAWTRIEAGGAALLGLSGPSASGGSFNFRVTSSSTAGSAITWNQILTGYANGSVAAGTASLATTATDGFLYIPSCAGTPTGVPTAVTGMAPLVIDSTNNKLYAYIGGAWRVMN